MKKLKVSSLKELGKVMLEIGANYDEKTGTFEFEGRDFLISSNDLKHTVNILKGAGYNIEVEEKRVIKNKEELEKFIEDISKEFIFDRFNGSFFKVIRFGNKEDTLKKIMEKVSIESLEEKYKVNLNKYKA